MAEVPVDKGVAWLVLVGAFMCGFLTVGGFKSIGILFVHVIEKYGASHSLTAWMMGLMSFGLAVYSPFATSLGIHYTYRTSVILGGFAMHLGFLLSAFAPNVYFIICVLGGLVGFANGFLYTPSMIMVGQYFNRHRSVAMGVAAAGGSFGQLVIPLIIRFLLDYYGYWGCMIIYSAFVLNGIVAGALLRPQSFYKSSRLKKSGPASAMKDAPGSIELAKTPSQSMNSLVFKSQILESLTSTPVTSLDDSKHVAILDEVEETILNSGPDVEILGSGERRDNCGVMLLEKEDDAEKNSEREDKEEPKGYLAIRYESTGSVRMINVNPVKDVAGNEFRIIADGNTNIDDILHKQQNSCTRCCHSCLQPFISLFDRNVLTKYVFWTYFVAVCLANAGYIDQFLFIPPYAKEIGINKLHTSSILAASGIADLIGRISGGFLNSLQLVGIHIFVSVTLFATGVIVMVTLMFPSYASLMVHGIVLGLIGGMYIALFPVILVHLIGLEKFPRAFACTMFGVGVSNLTLPTIFGTISEARGSYMVSFILLNVMMIIAGLMFLLIPRVQVLDDKIHAKNAVKLESVKQY